MRDNIDSKVASKSDTDKQTVDDDTDESATRFLDAHS